MLKNYFAAWQPLISVTGMLCFILVNYRAKAQRGINYQATGVHFAELGWAQAAPDDEKDQTTHTPRPHPSAAHPGDTSAPHRAKPLSSSAPWNFSFGHAWNAFPGQHSTFVAPTRLYHEEICGLGALLLFAKSSLKIDFLIKEGSRKNLIQQFPSKAGWDVCVWYSGLKRECKTLMLYLFPGGEFAILWEKLEAHPNL